MARRLIAADNMRDDTEGVAYTVHVPGGHDYVFLEDQRVGEVEQKDPNYIICTSAPHMVEELMEAGVTDLQSTDEGGALIPASEMLQYLDNILQMIRESDSDRAPEDMRDRTFARNEGWDED